MRLSAPESGLESILASLGTSIDSLLGQGGEAWVFGLDKTRIARITRGGASREQVENRRQLLAELGQSADGLSFAIPTVLEILEIEASIVTIEQRLPGRPLNQLLAEKKGQARDRLIRNYLNAASQIGDLTFNQPWYGDLDEVHGIRTSSFRDYLEKRAGQSLQAAGPEFRAIDPAVLAGALPEPDQPSFVHLDAFPGNMLAEDETVTAVIDFGASAIMGDRRLDPLTAAIYLDNAMTSVATDQDRAVAQEWLAENGLGAMFTAVQKWIAAYWSFARDDLPLYQWCQDTLLVPN